MLWLLITKLSSFAMNFTLETCCRPGQANVVWNVNTAHIFLLSNKQVLFQAEKLRFQSFLNVNTFNSFLWIGYLVWLNSMSLRINRIYFFFFAWTSNSLPQNNTPAFCNTHVPHLRLFGKMLIFSLKWKKPTFGL